MMRLSPENLRNLVELNTSSTDVRALQDVEKDLAKQHAAFHTAPPQIRVEMFDLLTMPIDPAVPSQRSKFLALMNNPKIDLQDLQFDMHVEGEGPDKTMYYSAVVIYQWLPFNTPTLEYTMDVFTLPGDVEAYGKFLSGIGGDTLVTKGDKDYIRKSSVVRTDRTFGMGGTIVYYYHTTSSYKEVGPRDGNDGIPEARKASHSDGSRSGGEDGGAGSGKSS